MVLNTGTVFLTFTVDSPIKPRTTVALSLHKRVNNGRNREQKRRLEKSAVAGCGSSPTAFVVLVIDIGLVDSTLHNRVLP
jgi:hypothetical protein